MSDIIKDVHENNIVESTNSDIENITAGLSTIKISPSSIFNIGIDVDPKCSGNVVKMDFLNFNMGTFITQHPDFNLQYDA